MASKYQGETAKAAAKVDPTVRSRGDVPEYPEGTHPPAPVEAQTWGPDRFDYGELEDKLKPDPTSIVSTVEPDPIEEANQEALRDSVDTARQTESGKSESSQR